MPATKQDLDNILFILRQTTESVEYGIPQNLANRTLKVILTRYWEHPMRKATSTTGKMNLPRSTAAMGITDRSELIVEHAVPRQVIVNELLAMNNPTRIKVRNLLRKYWRVILVTREEDRLLNGKGVGLRYAMTPDWDGKDPWARYRAVGIKLTKKALQQGGF